MLTSRTIQVLSLIHIYSVIDYEGNRTIWVKPYADFDKISYVTLVGDGK